MNQKEADNILSKWVVCLWFANAVLMAVAYARMKEPALGFVILVWLFAFIAMHRFLKYLTDNFKQPK